MSKPKIIASFDIGIRHLAYCVLEYLPCNIPGNQFKIYDWNVIDLLEDCDQKDKICHVTYRSGKKLGQHCENLAHFTAKGIDGKKINLCKTHSKSYTDDQLSRLYTTKNISLFELARLAITVLDKIDFSMCSEIVFESQVKMNPKMKNFSMMLFNYFAIKYVASKPASEQTVKDIRFISSRNKLTVYDGPYVSCDLKSQTARNKFYAKIHCRYVLRHNSEKMLFFESFKKKDDLADSFLQGAWHLMNTYKANGTEAKIIKNKLTIKLKKNMSDDNKKEENEEDEIEKEEIMEEDKEDEKENDNDIIDEEIIKPKLKSIKLKQKIQLKGTSSIKPKSNILVGKEHLLSVRDNDNTKQIQLDYKINQYRKLKKGAKAKENQKRYTLSNIKYVINKNKIITLKQLEDYGQTDVMLIPAIKYYFKKLHNFEQLLC